MGVRFVGLGGCGTHAMLLSSGVVISMDRDGKSFLILRSDGHSIRTQFPYQRFIELPDGQVVGETTLGDTNAFVFVQDESQVVYRHGEIAVSDGEIFCILNDGSVGRAPMHGTVMGTRAHAHSLFLPDALEWRRIGRNSYLGRYTRFAGDRDAYVGAPTHHEDRGGCWVIDGAPQPVFDAVTALFVDTDGCWCYWATSGRYLYKMAVPPVRQPSR
jgi:hypothetical protein